MKKISVFLLAFAMLVAMCVPVMAESTDDDGNLDVTDEMVFDVCMHNVWADKDAECMYPTVESVGVILTVTGYTGDPITTQLIVRESTTWLHWQSEPVEITGDGTYKYYVDMKNKKATNADGEEVGGPFDSANLLTVFVKDVNCCTEEESPLGKGNSSSSVTCSVHAEKVQFNKADPAASGSDDSTTAAAGNDGDGTEAATEASTTAAPAAAATTAASSDNSSENSSGGGLPTGAIVGIVVGVVAVIAIIVGVVIKKKK